MYRVKQTISSMSSKKKKSPDFQIKSDDYLVSLSATLSVIQEYSERGFNQMEKNLKEMEKLVKDMEKSIDDLRSF